MTDRESRERLVELIGKYEFDSTFCDLCAKGDKECLICGYEKLADHLIANGVIVPPCKVGQTVYYVSFGRIYKGKCHAITLKPTMQIHLYDYDGDNASISADRVFLTREEAKAKLKELGK